MVGKTKGRKEEVVNREYTINLHKRLHGWSEAEPVSKADKKFEKKLEFYAKIRDTVAALGANKDIKKKKKLRSRQKKLKPYDLSNLSEFLPDLKPQEQPPPVDDVKLNPKNMQKLILKEGHRMTTVLNHHAFKSDPLGAIHQHLLSTQPVVNDKPKKELKKKTKTKRKKAKASSGAQSMDI